MLPPSSVPSLTNPLSLYRALLATKRIEPDPAQHRLALHLQKLYFKLIDYSPKKEYGARIKAISRVVDKPLDNGEERSVALPGHPLRRNPLFSHLFPKRESGDLLSLTRVITDHEAAMQMDSPKGLLLHGEVGTGKSMLIDLLADGLPNEKKKRWHFNTFMLETLARLETLRQSRLGDPTGDNEHSLIWLAKDMVEKTPILFLDEFQLPDKAASKILSNLFTAFFQFGGVLIASSNRMPDELSKASGMDFVVPPRRGFIKSLVNFGRVDSQSILSNSEYAGFVDVLKARCEVWNMEGGRDWRRREIEEMDAESSEIDDSMREGMIGGFDYPRQNKFGRTYEQHGQTVLQGPNSVNAESMEKATNPKNYLLKSDNEIKWHEMIRSSLPLEVVDSFQWQATTLLVYGRNVIIPRQQHGVSSWTFSELCECFYGPADYITLASTFHTLILDEVPVLNLSQKNEARRFITLLDALYEARCKLLIRAEANPDDLFFPETKLPSTSTQLTGEVDEDSDAVYPETLAEIYQDQTSPFRPNISTYTDEPKTRYDSQADLDFGPIPGKGNEIGRTVDFGLTGSFTGEDERFAFKRAESRLWEMCGARWHARSEPGWWRPVPFEVRRWERSGSVSGASKSRFPLVKGDVKLGKSVELDKHAGLQGKLDEERIVPPRSKKSESLLQR